MPNVIKIDDIDEKILHILIQDARISLKKIAEQCSISSVSVINRINRLKKSGVITGSTLFPSLKDLGYNIVATIGIDTDADPEAILRTLDCYTTLVEPSTSIGEYDLCALVFAESFSSLNEKLDMLRRHYNIRRITINVWSDQPYNNFNNIDLKPIKDE
jgi:Lrp/AsnC family leucine-responsive transcriptional regulator